MTERRRIVAAAMRMGETIITRPPPARHHDLIADAWNLGIRHKFTSEDQAFIDNEGRFVCRAEAARIALDAGQIKELGWPPDLYSEDLW